MHPTQQPVADVIDQLVIQLVGDDVEDLVEADPNPAEILHAAAVYLRRHGWTQGTLYADDSGVMFPPACADGAICVAVRGRPVNGQMDLHQLGLIQVAERTLAEHLISLGEAVTTGAAGDSFGLISEWNDDPGRTVEHVIAALYAAADDWDRIHGGVR
jgi:hypothetical protein